MKPTDQLNTNLDYIGRQLERIGDVLKWLAVLATMTALTTCCAWMW